MKYFSTVFCPAFSPPSTHNPSHNPITLDSRHPRGLTLQMLKIGQRKIKPIYLNERNHLKDVKRKWPITVIYAG